MGRMKYQRDRYDKTKKIFFEHPDELQPFSLFSVLFSIPLFLTGLSIFVLSLPAHTVTAQDSCDMRDRLLRYFATCGQEKPLSGSLKRGEKNA